jgi:hypothetical protein
MLQDLAALTPPAIVCAAVLIGAWAIVRRELAPKRRERRAEAGVSADEERAVDREHGRSLYFPTSAIYRGSPTGYACLRTLRSPVQKLLRTRFRAAASSDCVHDNTLRS